MKRKKPEPSRPMPPAMSRRLIGIAKSLKELDKQIRPIGRRITKLEMLYNGLRARVDECGDIKGRLKAIENYADTMRMHFDGLHAYESKLRAAVSMISDFERRLEGISENVSELFKRANSTLPHEGSSGSRSSTLGPISELGRIPIDKNAAKDAGNLFKK